MPAGWRETACDRRQGRSRRACAQSAASQSGCRPRSLRARRTCPRAFRRRRPRASGSAYSSRILLVGEPGLVSQPFEHPPQRRRIIRPSFRAPRAPSSIPGATGPLNVSDAGVAFDSGCAARSRRAQLLVGGVEEDVVLKAAGTKRVARAAIDRRPRLFRTVEGQLDFAFEHSPMRYSFVHREEQLAGLVAVLAWPQDAQRRRFTGRHRSNSRLASMADVIGVASPTRMMMSTRTAGRLRRRTIRIHDPVTMAPRVSLRSQAAAHARASGCPARMPKPRLVSA